ncbi:MAG TPA: triose-phosphate isomerase [Candidatus Fermentibacter daniensis]|jgi:triosephosphate isomerase|nr:MAG: hypothetical protein AO395_00675 [Candidatus Fermentibacter daniensis]MCC6871367.1 triose-phosphate isomerase [Candidatus Fermentibacter sp.]HOA05288.1 triose-phosphate isomerase [Candidatus Fermentibacter daniensis]HOD19021.1 triose-phosphate isomerase [Candidatus Fermentibacter daniensis]HOZ17680.1 triose-phosphate isomerase [Candidatus Fermentibacter daniensis]
MSGAGAAGRRRFTGANWKMNGSGIEGISWLETVQAAAADGSLAGLDLVLFPPFTLLPVLAEGARGAGIVLGAQDVYYEKKGAFTGEVSAAMLIEAGCSWVLAGHSERRHLMGESDEMVSRKVASAIESGLGVVLCVGERLAERDSGIETEVVDGMLSKALEGLQNPDPSRIVIAYEPVWAIGTGRNASPEQASAMHGHIRDTLRRITPGGFAEACRIIYGGSVNPGNAQSIVSMPDVDGALVGGASLEALSFLQIARAGV